MAEGEEELPVELRCNRTDGRKWWCKRRVMDGKKLCEIHFLQAHHRQHKEKVPDYLKLERKSSKPKNQQSLLEIEEIGAERSNNIPNPLQKSSTKKLQRKSSKPKNQQSLLEIEEVRAERSDKIPNPLQKSSKKKRKRTIDMSEALDGALKKMKLKRGDLQLELIRVFLKREVEKKKERQLSRENKEDLLKELPYGVLTISQSQFPQNFSNAGGSCNFKVGSASNSITRRCFRSKNIEPLPISTMQILPCARNVVKKRKKCHWCRKSSYRVIVKCSTCRKQFFCVDCIQERYFDKQDVKRECPVCRGTCSCRTCSANQSKDIKNKEVYQDKQKFDKVQLLHYLINTLLPLLEQINQEKSIELEIEAKMKGIKHNEVHVARADIGDKTMHCCYCKISIMDFHRSCSKCSYSLCLSCCQEFREGHLHKVGIRRKKLQGHDRRKVKVSNGSLQNWKICDDGTINCPPKIFGGCGDRTLFLKSQSPLGWTQKLEASARVIVCDYSFPKPSDVTCSLCVDKRVGEINLSQELARQESSNLEHFQKHWGKGQPLILQNLLQSTSELSWDPVIMFNTYLEKSAMSRNDKEAAKATKCLDWCEVEIGMKQIFMGSLEGKAHANVCHEMVKFKVWLSSRLFQEQFPYHYAEMMQSLPLQEYLNPLSGLLNLAMNLPRELATTDFGPCIYISYGGPEEIMQPHFSTNLSYESYDVVNILAHTTDASITEEELNKLKFSMNKYNGPCHKEALGNNINQNPTSEVNGKSSLHSEETQESCLLNGEGSHSLPNGTSKLSVFSGDSHEPCPELGSEASVLHSNGEDSDDDDEEDTENSSCEEERFVDSCGARWDIFRRQDVPKIVEYLKKYTNEFSHGYRSPKRVVHPIFDQRFFLDSIHKLRLKEEFNVEPWTIEQHVGEAVIIPAGCPYQIRRLKSCVNVVVRFISPENASECFKVVDELRQLPANHKSKEKMFPVKKMTLHSLTAAIEEVQSLSRAENQTELAESAPS